jgi:hypothetical protein
MKQKIFLGLIALTGVAIMGCKKNVFREADLDSTDGKAIIKVAYFSADSISRTVQVYINNGLVSNNITSFTPYPGGGYNTGGNTDNGFLAVDASKGSAEFRFVTTNAGSTIISKELFKVSAPVYPNVQQVVFITDTAANTTAFTIKTETTRPDSGYAKIQFTNTIPNSGAIDFYYADSLVASNVAYKGLVDFVTLPLKVSPTLKIYPTGATPIAANLLGQSYTFSGIGNKRIYTALGRGWAGIKATNDIRIPKVSLVIVK